MDYTSEPLCRLAPEQMAGPYFRNTRLQRVDITEGLPGVRMDLTLRLIDVNTCEPLEGAWIDIWHCDSRGRYSGWSQVDPDQEAPTGDIGAIPRTDDETYLRGHDSTDENGQVGFVTLFPGFYAGRAIHVHVAVHLADERQVAFVGQLYFPPLISQLIHGFPDYAGRQIPRLENHQDALYLQTLARSPNLTVAVTSLAEPADRLLGFIEMGIDPEARSEHIRAEDFDHDAVGSGVGSA